MGALEVCIATLYCSTGSQVKGLKIPLCLSHRSDLRLLHPLASLVVPDPLLLLSFPSLPHFPTKKYHKIIYYHLCIIAGKRSSPSTIVRFDWVALTYLKFSRTQITAIYTCTYLNDKIWSLPKCKFISLCNEMIMTIDPDQPDPKPG